MSEKTGISWTDHTFNPWWGCVKVSPACTNCYAERDSKRYGFKVWGPESERRFFGNDHWKEPLRWNKAAEKAGTRRRVFCASMADVFEEHRDPVVDEGLDRERMRLFELISLTTSLDWLLLTKRPENIPKLLPPWWVKRAPRPNIWLGTTVENQVYAAERIPQLLRVDAVVHFVSYEPALGPVDFCNLDTAPELHLNALTGIETMCEVPAQGPRLDWIIAGGESGPNARPSHPEWFRSVRDQCQAVGVPFHFKQWGEWLPGHQYTGDLARRDSGDQISRFDCRDWNGTTYDEADQLEEMSGDEVYRVGKKAAGRLLDEREWNGFPAAHS